MAVPKKRTGASAQGKRRANWKAKTQATVTCPKCGAIALAHTVCTECGYYKGKPASIKHEDYKAEIAAKPAKKTAEKKAKTTKKAAVTEEAKIETTAAEEVKTEEIKAEEVKAKATKPKTAKTKKTQE